MTDTISKAAKAKAKELAAAVDARFANEYTLTDADCALTALACVLQEHSDKARRVSANISSAYRDQINILQSMILPDDEPEPLASIIGAFVHDSQSDADIAADFRQALSAAGYEIRRKDG